MKGCELCKAAARVQCESDQASLCWDCDAKVHGANFLAKRHSRSLLCHACQAPTPWMACGAKLVPTVSLCERCADACGGATNGSAERDDDVEDEFDEDDDVEEEEEEEEDEGLEVEDEVEAEVEDDAENQVVPWSCSPPPPSESSSGSEDSSNRPSNGGADDTEPSTRFSVKRPRRNASNLESEDDLDCASSPWNGLAADGEATSSVDSSRLAFERPKKARTTPDGQSRHPFEISGSIRPAGETPRSIDCRRRSSHRD